MNDNRILESLREIEAWMRGDIRLWVNTWLPDGSMVREELTFDEWNARTTNPARPGRTVQGREGEEGDG